MYQTDTIEQDVIILTERAARQMEKIIADSGAGSNKHLRIGVKGGGCSGLSYFMEFDEHKELDEKISQHGVEIIIDKRHAMYLQGTILDFKDGLDARGFIFENPKASTTCGCGSSFSA
jgi:iron-sulfur cluster assembly protein